MRILSEFIQEDSKIITIQIGLNEEIEVKRKKRSKNANIMDSTIMFRNEYR